MEVELHIEEEGSGRNETREVEVEEGSTVKEVLKEAGINTQTVIVELDGKIITQKDEVSGEKLRVLEVISGG